jgi:hypothetical protein
MNSVPHAWDARLRRETMQITTLATAAALSLGLGAAIAGGTSIWADDAQSVLPQTVTPAAYQRDEGDWAGLTTRQTDTVKLAYVTTTRGESSQTENQNEGVGG